MNICTAFIPNSPKDILALDFNSFKNFLMIMLGKDVFYQAYQSDFMIKSPVSNFHNSDWFKKSKIIGINPRITGSFFNIVKYATTFCENAIHIMPFFETGHDESLYVQNSWRISEEFFDENLANDGFDTIEKQLKVIINLLHAMGKAVGFDVLPHVDNFSEIVFLNPSLFEWAKLNDNKTSQLFPPEIDYNKIYLDVENEIVNFLKLYKYKDNNLTAKKLFEETTEKERHSIIFGKDKKKWNNIRISLMNYIRQKGYETLPVTEHSPSRPIIFDKINTKNGINWSEFSIKNKSEQAIILGCITPYKWYEIDNEGYPNANKPELRVWSYFIDKYKNIQNEYNFDFMRGDMAHNQIPHASKIPIKQLSEFWKFLKQEIQKNTPYFASLAEAFYNTHYINGYTDMMNKDFDVVLGNMNFRFLDEEFINHLKDYINIHPQFSFSPCVCVFTNDADKKENNALYQSPLANDIRIFCGYFLNQASYTGIGYELRNLLPKKPEQYTFNYIKKMKKPYCWGNNEEFLSTVFEMREIYCQITKEIKNPEIKLCYTNSNSALSWIFTDELNNIKYLFCFNLDKQVKNITITFDKNHRNYNSFQGYYSNLIDNFKDKKFDMTKSKELILKDFPIGSCCILKNITDPK